MEDGKVMFKGASGKWAGEQMLKALEEGKPLTPSILRTNATLRKDEWKHFDEALVEEATIRLQGVADLIAAGLTIPIANAMGKTMFEWENIDDMADAQLSMDGATRTENDRHTYELDSLPLPIMHKDFWIHLRTLSASRERGESLDTTQIRTAGRLIAEETEKLLFQGSSKVYAGKAIYGYMTQPDRNQETFGTNGAWSATAKTGENILKDVLTMVSALETARHYGPYWLYIPRNSSTKLENDFKSNSDKTIRQRLMEVDQVQKIQTIDQLTSDNIIMVQPTRDVVAMVQGIPLQTVQWDIEGGFIINFKAFQISIPLLRSTNADRSGICHMTT